MDFAFRLLWASAARGLAGGSEEGAILRGMLIDTHGYVEGFLNACHRALELHIKSIARAANHREAVRFREANHGIVIFLARTKAFGKLRHRNIVTEFRTGRVVDFLQEIF